MYFKRLKPYIVELCVFLVIFAGLAVFFTATQSVVIYWNTLFVLFLLTVALWFIQYVFSFVPFAILVVADLVLKNYETINARFIEQYVFKSSFFLDKSGKRNKREGVQKVETLYFKIIVKDAKGVRIFTSSEYFELQPMTKYGFVIGRKSKAIVDICNCE